MKKICMFIFILFIPFLVSAKTNSLYEDLKQRAISNNQLVKIDDNVYIFKGGTSNNIANYVRFNNGLWRIIGIYNNQLKIINASSIGRYKFDDRTMKITYPDSELSEFLNDNYLNSFNADSKSMIDMDGIWNIGATKQDSKAAEAYEDAKKTTYKKAMGIMATYEFLYASNGDGCYDVNGDVYSRNCGKALYDWLTPAQNDSWTLTPYYFESDATRGVPLNISPSGYVSSGSGNAASMAIYPALYLKTNVKLDGGTGTNTDPYVLDFYYANSINVEKNEGIESIDFDIDDITEVEYETEVKFSIKVKEGYKLQNIKILNKDNEEIEYTNNGEKYEFIMPNLDVFISFVCEDNDRNYKFVEGMGQTFDVVNDSRLRFRVNMEYKDFINGGTVYIDNKLVDPKNYDISEGSTIIIFKDDYSRSLSLGDHKIVAQLKNGKTATTDFIIDEATFRKVENPVTSDKVVLIILLAMLSLVGIVKIYRKRVFR